MAGRGTISVNQTPQYGDKTKLDQLNKNMTKTPMSGVPTPAPTAGRPPTGGQQEPQPQAGTQQADIPPEHMNRMNDLAESFRVHQFWQNVIAQYPSEWSKVYAREAERIYQMKQMELRQSTPFFE